MKNQVLLLLAFCVLSFGVLGAMDDIQIGRVNIPKAFIHQEREYAQGVYQITLSEKEGLPPTFQVKNTQGELLFEELAVVKAYEGKGKNFKPRIHKVFLKDYEYFRIQVTTPQSVYMVYFLTKKDTYQPSPSSEDPK
jgi:hypothetical protein